MEKYCWATLLGTDEYIDGVIGVYYNLKEVGSKYPLIVLYFQDIKQETLNRLKEANIESRLINHDIFGELAGHCGCCSNELTINKFQIFNFTEYDKICFIDADVILYFNLDYIFKYNYPIAHMASWGGGAGGIFTVIPEAGKYKEIKEKYGSYCANDEQIQNILFLEQYMINCSLLTYDSGFFHHRGGSPKYWNYLNLHTNDRIKKFMQLSTNSIYHLLYHGYKNKKKTE